MQSKVQQEFSKKLPFFPHCDTALPAIIFGLPIWENDVHVVRDPVHASEWLVVIDMYPGASTWKCMESGKAEMVAVLEAKPAAARMDNRIGRMLKPAEPLCYDFSEFERTNGKILNTGSDVQY